ncbi:hypothetical protein B0J11DRAFT_441922 [Dendryphion nanum]|uniref:MYND-type domain-containing protein n=1 Tax=Dendryphion nanum TaxID=256645 RepID=A0A9P9DFB9_9PLEO|nr:hypothetical protein B0J11DRAFT_441922 [Dendryphion nanum]
MSSCTTCKKTGSEVPNLRVCAKCKVTLYCSRDCQKVDWKVHKKICAKQDNESASSNSSSSTPKSDCLDVSIAKPFTALENNTYLHNRSDRDVFKLLVDSFRMRQADDFKFEQKKDPRSVYSGAASSIDGFRRFITLASSRRGLLPTGWDAEKQKACENFGLESGDFSSLKKKTSKEEIQGHYGNEKMPMQLRMLGEAVYGIGPMGQDGTQMRGMMAKMENGGLGNLSATMLSLHP